MNEFATFEKLRVQDEMSRWSWIRTHLKRVSIPMALDKDEATASLCIRDLLALEVVYILSSRPWTSPFSVCCPIDCDESRFTSVVMSAVRDE